MKINRKNLNSRLTAYALAVAVLSLGGCERAAGHFNCVSDSNVEKAVSDASAKGMPTALLSGDFPRLVFGRYPIGSDEKVLIHDLQLQGFKHRVDAGEQTLEYYVTPGQGWRVVWKADDKGKIKDINTTEMETKSASPCYRG